MKKIALAFGTFVLTVLFMAAPLVSNAGEITLTAPQNFSAKAVNATTVSFSWDAVEGAEFYRVYKSSTGEDGTWAYICASDGTQCSASYAKLSCGTTYYFRVRAMQNDEEAAKGVIYGPASEVVSATPVLSQSKVTSVKAERCNMTVKWKAVDKADGYRVYRSRTGGAGNYTFACEVTASTTSYIDTGLKANQTYYYCVRAFKKVSGKYVFGAYSKGVCSKTGSYNGVVCLTFDDGPSSNVTPYVLDVLKKNNVKATFFVVNYSSSNKKIIQRIVNEGHTIALHCYTHDYAKAYKSADAYMKYLYALQSKIYKDTGRKPYVMRFIGGSSNTVSCNYCSGVMTQLAKRVLKEGFKYWDWNVSAGDAGGTTVTSKVYSNVVNSLSKNRINVVLQHDCSDKMFSAKALQDIITTAKKRGYTFSRITLTTPQVHHGIAN